MLKLEFLADGSPDWLLVRLYDFEPEDAVSLRQIFISLSHGSRELAHLDSERGFESIGGCRLTLRSGNRDLGVVQKAKTEFECILIEGAWDNMAGLVEPFCTDCSGYQWLDEHGKISLLISKTGQW